MYKGLELQARCCAERLELVAGVHVLTGHATPKVALMKKFRVQRHAYAHALDLSVTVLRKLAESACQS